MTKTIVALVAAGILGTAAIPVGAQTMVPNNTANMSTDQTKQAELG